MKEESMNCKSTWEKFLNKDFNNWKGLSKSCTPSFFDSLYTIGHLPEGSSFSGLKEHPVKFKSFKTKEYAEPLRLYFSKEELFKISVEYPELNYSELLKILGTPSIKLDYYWDILQVKEGEIVYPEKGISLNLNPEKDSIVKLTVFTPLTAQEYKDKLYHTEQAREFPSE